MVLVVLKPKSAVVVMWLEYHSSNASLTLLLPQGTHLYRRCMSESIKGEYGPYWGYVEDSPVEDFVAIEFPRVTPGARKSFSELLIETDTLDKGPLALYVTSP